MPRELRKENSSIDAPKQRKRERGNGIAERYKERVVLLNAAKKLYRKKDR